MRDLVLAVVLLLAAAPAPQAAPQQQQAATPLAERPVGPDCASERAAAILHMLESALPEAGRASAGARIARIKGGEAKAWHDLGVALYLRGRMLGAAWASLKAITAAPQPASVASAGTILIALGANEDAQQLLRCARTLGDRSPYTLEALAAVEAAMGDQAAAKAAIDEIPNDALGDPMIDIERSLLDTGKPPPLAPQPVDALERCVARLDRHAGAVLAAMERRDLKYAEIMRLAGQPFGYQPLIDSLRRSRATTIDRLRADIAKAAAGSDNPRSFNNVLTACILGYFRFTGDDTADLLRDPLSYIFWARTLQVGPKGLAADVSSNALIGKRARQQYADDVAANFKENDPNHCPAGSGNHACFEAVQRAQCAKWQSLMDGYADETKQRFNTAAHGFDSAATQLLRRVADKVDDARGFAARTMRDIKPGRTVGAAGTEGDALRKSLDLEAHRTVDILLTRDADRFIRARIDRFVFERRITLEHLAQKQKEVDDHCIPVIFKSVFDELAKEALEEYQKELWDRLAGDVTADYDAKASCTFSLGDVELELSEEGASLSSKWQGIQTKLDQTGKLKVSGGWKGGPGGIDIDQSGKIKLSMSSKSEVGSAAEGKLKGSVTIDGGEIVGASVGGSIDPGGIEGEGSITILSDRNPNTGRNEPALQFKGSVSVGLKSGAASVSCTPGEVSAEIFPRSFVADAIKYALSGAH